MAAARPVTSGGVDLGVFIRARIADQREVYPEDPERLVDREKEAAERAEKKGGLS
jgi:hypothetical protein